MGAGARRSVCVACKSALLLRWKHGQLQEAEMAKAKAGRRQTPRKVTLHLTEGEADLILALTSMVSGDRRKGPRKYARRISRALTDALGYGATDTDAGKLAIGAIDIANYGSPEPRLAKRILAQAAVSDFAGRFDGPEGQEDLEALLAGAEFVELIDRLPEALRERGVLIDAG